ncbi:MAG: FAD-dependent oxidoreductase [Anaerolineae bacterium]|nr:FAD-dependent oxidoreductase [Anaerolineae bacterium]
MNTQTPSPTRIVILGAGYAGMNAALRLAHHTRGLPVALTLVNAGDTFVERVRLHQTGQVRQRPIGNILRETNVRFVQARVLSITPDAQTVTVQRQDEQETLAYDYLLYALGSSADKTSISGVREHTLAVGDPADAARLHERLAHLPSGGQVVVVGGGLTGIETAAEIAEAYPALRVRLVTSGVLGATLSASGRAHLHAVFARFGVAVQEHSPVARVEAGALISTSGESIPFDVCAWAGSFRALPLGREAGLPVNARDQILVDAALRSVAHANIYVAGDSAALTHDPGAPIRMACATALPLASHAADNLYARLTGGEQRPFGFGYFFQCISLGRQDGLIQFVRPDDSPTERILTGRAAAWVKEAVCRYAAAMAATPFGARNHRWPKQHRAAQHGDENQREAYQSS